MKITKEKLNLEQGIEREWVITNGIGGFSASTVLGINTRKYHGLLVAPLIPPANRHLLLSKVDESIVVDDVDYPIYANICKSYISKGYEYLESFEKKYIPEFCYSVCGIQIRKRICMEYGKNAVVISYHIKNIDKHAMLKLTPIMNFRDFHCMSTNHDYTIKQTNVRNTKVKVVIDHQSTFPIYMHVSEGNYIPHQNDIFKNMYYLEEEKRGFYPEEDHIIPGRFEIPMAPNEEKNITFVCSLEENIEEINADSVIEKEIKRLQQVVEQSELVPKKKLTKKAEKEYYEILEDLVIAADSFIINRHSFGTHSIIAGYPWFLDWGRDALIAYEGLLLKTKRFELAKEVLLTFTRDIKFGLVPNGYSGFDSRPLYNSVDSSLLLFEQVQKYIEYTGDKAFVQEKLYEKLKTIIKNYSEGIDLDDNNIYLDKDYLLVSGTPNTQNTWMDAKVGDFAVTPRNGKAVEINSLWYNALKILESLAETFYDKETKEQCEVLAKKNKYHFERKFYNPSKKCLYDVLGDDKIRPNQLFALSLTYPVLNPASEKAQNMLDVCTQKLLSKYGLKTLAKGEENYVAIYEGNGEKRDKSYHQGITWVWLITLLTESYRKVIEKAKTEKTRKELTEKRKQIIHKFYQTMKTAIYEDAAVGTISEIYDSEKPYHAVGTFSQAWSVSEVIKVLLDEEI